jgi:hypothetical protein
MRNLPNVFVFIVLLALPVLLAFPVFASSAQAYQDYLYQFDLYRQTHTDFQVAKNEYEKFKSLSAQTSALEKTKRMLSQRDSLLRSYLQLLNEKLNEDEGLTPTVRQQYQTRIKNEITFLDTHMTHVPAATSPEELTQISEELESHYIQLHISIRQTLTGLALGQLSTLATGYDKALTDGQNVIAMYGYTFPSEKQETIQRWILQIQNKRSLFQKKYDETVRGNTQTEARDIRDLDREYEVLTQNISEARQYLQEGASFLVELMNALKYID